MFRREEKKHTKIQKYKHQQPIIVFKTLKFINVIITELPHNICMCLKFICVEKCINAITTDAVVTSSSSFNKIKSVIVNVQRKDTASQHSFLLVGVFVVFVCVRKSAS